MTAILENIKKRWQCESGYREVLIVAIPLILSTGAWSVQHFVDRMFLTWHSSEAVAASMPAGLLNFTFISIFQGIASYVGTFVAQYYGSGQHKRIGPAIWQGNYVALVGGAFLFCMIPLAKPFFTWVNHDPIVQANEIAYFKILCLGGFPVIACASLSSFFAGRGKTWPIMWITLLSTAVNLVGDYCLIFGNWGFPKWGIEGAAITSVLSAVVGFLIYIILFAQQKYNNEYHLLKGWRFDSELFKRLLKFGLPSGFQFFLDIASFTAFLFLVGSLGTKNLAATTIAFNINTLSFMPMLGMGIAVSILVGQNIGKNQPELASKCTYSGLHMAMVYMIGIASLYMFWPQLFIAPFASEANPEEFAPIGKIATTLLKFVAIYSTVDALNIIFASAIKGAGDTRYVMLMIVVLSSVCFILPTYIALQVFNAGVYAAWIIVTIYIMLLALAFYIRFIGGKWKKMRVIEETPGVSITYPEAPTEI